MKVTIPTVLRKHTDGLSEVSVSGATVGEALEQLVEKHPPLKDSLFDQNGALVSFVGVFLGEENIRDLDNEATELRDSDEILLVPAIAGG